MGFNYGKKRPRNESFKDLSDIISASIGSTKYNFERFSIVEETAKITNENLDEVQRRYNERFDFPNE